MLREGQFSAAISDLNQTVTFDPRATSRIRIPLARAHFGRSHEHQRNGDFTSAIDQLGRALTLKPDYAEAFHNLGNVFRLRNQLKLALDLATAIQQNKM